MERIRYKYLNEQVANFRDMLLFGEKYDTSKYIGGVRHFGEITLETLERLVDAGLADKDDCQNNAPSIEEFMKFIRERTSDGWYLHGYAVSADRDDCRISIEGCGCRIEGYSAEDVEDFVYMFRYADDFVISGELFCWYD